MTAFAYIGAAEDAAGFRLAGVRCWTPRGNETDALREAMASGVEAVFLTAQVAERVARAELESALTAGRPLIVLLPEPGLPPCRLEPAERVRAQLGLDA